MTEIRQNLKAQLLRAIVLGTEAAGLMDQPKFLTAIGMPDDWIMRAVDNADAISLDEFVQVYNEAAAQAGWRSLAEIVRTATDLQRYREWPA